MTLKVDPKRADEYEDECGIYVRAVTIDGEWINADIFQLTKESLFEFLRSRGGKNEWAENVVALLLGHGQFDLVEEKTQ